jgi:hypothetical protein
MRQINGTRILFGRHRDTRFRFIDWFSVCCYFEQVIFFEIFGNGDVAKWLNALVCKISSARTRQFESDRHLRNSFLIQNPTPHLFHDINTLAIELGIRLISVRCVFIRSTDDGHHHVFIKNSNFFETISR